MLTTHESSEKGYYILSAGICRKVNIVELLILSKVTAL